MIDLKISIDRSITDPAVIAMLEHHVQELIDVTPPGSSHALDLGGLRDPAVTFWVVLVDDTLAGCGAIKWLDDQSGEIKSMRVQDGFRGQGIAAVMLQHILDFANREGMTRVYLETGSFDFFVPARRLYEKFGFSYCDPFADYELDPNSVFMTLDLSK